MLHLGIDVHKLVSQVEVMDDFGATLDQQRLDHRDRRKLERYFGRYRGDAIATLEATRNWYWLYELLEECGLEVKLAHPLKVRLIAEARVKTDKVDAHTLAQLERTGFLPESYIPSREVRDQRELLRYRASLVRMRTGLKNRVHALLSKLGVFSPLSDLFGKQGRVFLRTLDLRGIYREELDGYLATLDFLETKIKELTGEIKSQLRDDPRAKLLITIPGVSHLTAHLILSEIGEIERFHSSKHLCSYAGLVPSTHQSGSHHYQGKITKQGNRYLRWAMVESAQTAVTKDGGLAAFYRQLKAEKGTGRAKVAVGRKLLTAVYYILKRNTPYQYNKVGREILGKPVRRTGQIN
jgi:transposase